MAGSVESRLGNFDRLAAVEAFRARLRENGVVDAPTDLTADEFKAAVFGGRELLICYIKPYLARGRQIILDCLSPVLSRLAGHKI